MIFEAWDVIFPADSKFVRVFAGRDDRANVQRDIRERRVALISQRCRCDGKLAIRCQQLSLSRRKNLWIWLDRGQARRRLGLWLSRRFWGILVPYFRCSGSAWIWPFMWSTTVASENIATNPTWTGRSDYVAPASDGQQLSGKRRIP